MPAPPVAEFPPVFAVVPVAVAPPAVDLLVPPPLLVGCTPVWPPEGSEGWDGKDANSELQLTTPNATPIVIFCSEIVSIGSPEVYIEIPAG